MVRTKKWRMPGLEIKFFTQGAERPSDSGQIAFLKWDTRILSAVAIDGQHRIAALKKFRDSSHPDAANSDVPATFLVFDPRLPKDKHLLDLVREIFEDVKITAREPSSHAKREQREGEREQLLARSLSSSKRV